MSAEAFAQTAQFYDLLYQGKDYSTETRWVDNQLRRLGARPGALLDIGCGTGGHAREFTKLGWQVAGVDASAAMIAIAREKTPSSDNLAYFVGTAAGFDLGHSFEAVVSLFHVASYMTGASGLFKMLSNARHHLNTGGVLVFDFWHGPGVFADPPSERTRRIEGQHFRASRTARPSHHPLQNLIEVDYEILVDGAPEPIHEVHSLHYYFLPEIEFVLSQAGFSLKQSFAGLSDDPITERSWYALVVAQAI